jgi:hypothetical protein
MNKNKKKERERRKEGGREGGREEMTIHQIKMDRDMQSYLAHDVHFATSAVIYSAKISTWEQPNHLPVPIIHAKEGQPML